MNIQTLYYESWLDCPKDVKDFLVDNWTKSWLWGLDNILKVSDVLVEKIWNIILWVRTFSIDTKVLWLVVVSPDSRKKWIASKLTDIAVQKIRERYSGILKIESIASSQNWHKGLKSAQRRLPPDTEIIIDYDK